MISGKFVTHAASALVLVAGLAHFSSAQAATITSLPFTITSSGTYTLGSSLTYSGSGAAISVNASNVTIDGGGSTLRYCDASSSCSGITLNNATGVTIKNITFQQGSGGSGTVASIVGSGNNVIIDSAKFNLIAKPTANVFGSTVMTTSSGSELRNSTFTITGSDTIEAIDQAGSSPWLVHDNKVSVVGVGFTSTYARVINVGSGSQYYNNNINVDSNSHYINVFVSWQQSNAKIYSNTINYASHHGRPIHLDDSSSGFEIYDNTITVTSQNVGDEVVYVFRLRSDAGHKGSSNHNIHHNTVDTSGATNTLGVSIGADTYPNQNNQFSYNIFKSRGSAIDFYGDYALNTSFFCNQIIHTATTGYPITVLGTLHQGIVFENNLITTQRTDGEKVDFSAKPAYSGSWTFTNTGVTTSNITGNLLSSAFAMTAAATKSTANCYQSAGARTASAPRPNPPTGVTVQ